MDYRIKAFSFNINNHLIGASHSLVSISTPVGRRSSWSTKIQKVNSFNRTLCSQDDWPTLSMTFFLFFFLHWYNLIYKALVFCQHIYLSICHINKAATACAPSPSLLLLFPRYLHIWGGGDMGSFFLCLFLETETVQFNLTKLV